MFSKPPQQKSFSVDPGRYKAILVELEQSPDAKDLVIAEDQHSGSVSYKGAVDLTWRYDGTGVLAVVIVKEHGTAVLAPRQSIFNYIDAHLITLKPVAPAPAPLVPSDPTPIQEDPYKEGLGGIEQADVPETETAA